MNKWVCIREVCLTCKLKGKTLCINIEYTLWHKEKIDKKNTFHNDEQMSQREKQGRQAY